MPTGEDNVVQMFAPTEKSKSEDDWLDFMDRYPKWIRVPLKKVVYSAYFFVCGALDSYL